MRETVPRGDLGDGCLPLAGQQLATHGGKAQLVQMGKPGKRDEALEMLAQRALRHAADRCQLGLGEPIAATRAHMDQRLPDVARNRRFAWRPGPRCEIVQWHGATLRH
jgi:hypothetical protein